MAPARNDPCPCGSAKKYKKCCAGKVSLGKARAEESDDDIPQPTLDLSEMEEEQLKGAMETAKQFTFGMR